MKTGVKILLIVLLCFVATIIKSATGSPLGFIGSFIFYWAITSIWNKE